MKIKTKQTATGEIPKDWEEEEIGNIVSKIVMGQAPPSNSYNNEGIGIPFVKATEFGEKIPKIRVWTTKSLKEVNEDYVLLSIAGTIGLVNKGITCSIGRSVAGLKPNFNKITKDYFFYYLKKIAPHLIGRGSSQKIIVKKNIEKIKIPLPPLLEQKAIAEVLSTIDETIEKSDQIIQKTERLKKGLMQELLTKGIGHKEFKDVEIGRIPKEWEVVRLDKIVTLIKGKKPMYLTNKYEDGTLPYLSTEYLREGVNQKYTKPLNLVIVDDDDIILLWDGSNAGEFFVGKKGVLSSTMVKFLIKREDIDDLYLYYLLKTKEKFLQGQTRGTGIPHVDRDVLNNLKIPLLPLKEQHKIASILSAVDERIEKERQRKEKLERIKKGLMNDLLTGSKRVRV